MEVMSISTLIFSLGVSYIISLIYAAAGETSHSGSRVGKAICGIITVLSIVLVVPAICIALNNIIFRGYYDSCVRLEKQMEAEESARRRAILEEEYYYYNADDAEAPDIIQTTSATSTGSKTVPLNQTTVVAQGYCKLCGSPLNAERKCTSCGKQYFHIRRGILLKLYAFCVTLALVVFVCENNRNVNNTNEWMNLYNDAHGQIEEINKVLEDSHISREGLFHNVGRIYSFPEEKWIENPAPIYENLTTPQIVETLISSYFKQKEEIIHWLGEISSIQKDLDFYENNAVLVTRTGTKYHKYGCYHLDDVDAFWIYNTEAAKGRGYTACADCW